MVTARLPAFVAVADGTQLRWAALRLRILQSLAVGMGLVVIASPLLGHNAPYGVLVAMVGLAALAPSLLRTRAMIDREESYATGRLVDGTIVSARQETDEDGDSSLVARVHVESPTGAVLEREFRWSPEELVSWRVPEAGTLVTVEWVDDGRWRVR
jgi:hypothetical protein